MIEVYAGVGALALVAVAGVVLASRRRTGPAPAAAAVSAAVFADRRDELATEARGQGLSTADAAALEAELAANLADEIDASAGTTIAQAEGSGLPLARLAAVGLLAAAPSVALYAWWGEPSAPLLARTQTLLNDAAAPPEKLAALKAALSRRASRHPENVDAPFYLGLAHLRDGDYGSAENAFAALHRRFGPTPAVDAAWAQAAYMAAGAQVTPAVRRIMDRVFAAQPEHLTMLELLAADAMRRTAFAEAAGYLSRAAAQAEAGPQRRLLLGALAAARQRAGASTPATQGGAAAGTDAPTARAPETSAPEETPAMAIEVSLAPAFEAHPTTPVFIVARAAGATRGPPLAVRRLAAGDLPAAVTLSSANTMLPGQRLTATEDLEVIARVSLSGSAIAQPGDLQSEPAIARPGGPPVRLRIDRRVPPKQAPQ